MALKQASHLRRCNLCQPAGKHTLLCHRPPPLWLTHEISHKPTSFAAELKFQIVPQRWHCGLLSKRNSKLVRCRLSVKDHHLEGGWCFCLCACARLSSKLVAKKSLITSTWRTGRINASISCNIIYFYILVYVILPQGAFFLPHRLDCATFLQGSGSLSTRCAAAVWIEFHSTCCTADITLWALHCETSNLL